MKKITDYLPKTSTNTVLVQAKIDNELHASVKQRMKTDNIGWHDLIEAACKMYVNEKQSKK